MEPCRLAIARDEEQFHARPDHVRVFHHVGEQDPEDRAVQRIDLVVPQADVTPALRIASNEGFQRVGKHLPAEPRHLHDLRLRRDRPALGETDGGLRDVHRVIAYALQVGRDLERGDQGSEVAGHGLLERQEAEALFLQLHFHHVDDPVAVDDPLGAGRVAFEQGLDGQAERSFRFARHGEQADLHLAQLIVKVPVGLGHPNLPVM